MGNKKKKLSIRVLDSIEKVGNKMWDPVTLFLLLSFILIVSSALLSKLGVSAVHPGTDETIKVVNLMSKAGLQDLISSITDNFQSFPPLGLVLIVIIGAGLADKTGLMTATIKHGVMKAPDNLVTAIIVFLGMGLQLG